MSEPANATQPVTIAPDGANRFKQVAPVGAAALAIAVAVVGGTVLTERRDDSPAPSVAFEAPAETAPTTSELPAELPAQATAETTKPDMPPAAATLETTPDPGLKPPAMKPGGAGAGLSIPGVAQNQVPGAVANAGIEVVVKFKSDAAVKDIIDTFWKDAEGARKKFETFKTKHPLFVGTRLDRVTYSNELVVTSDGALPAAKGLVAMREIAAKLSTSSEISYAEPNLTAHPGVK